MENEYNDEIPEVIEILESEIDDEIINEDEREREVEINE